MCLYVTSLIVLPLMSSQVEVIDAKLFRSLVKTKLFKLVWVRTVFDHVQHRIRCVVSLKLRSEASWDFDCHW